MKNKICDIAEEYKSILWEIADYLHANPELGKEEFKSADFLKKQLIKESFKVVCICFIRWLSYAVI